MTEWLSTSLPLWVEAIALMLLFIWEIKGRKEPHEEMLQQLDIARKQIHADRVAEIFKALRQFENWLVESVHKTNRFGPGRDFSVAGDANFGGPIFQQYLDLQEAYYLSYLVSAPLAEYMKERISLRLMPCSEYLTVMSFIKDCRIFTKSGMSTKWPPRSENYPKLPIFKRG